MTSSAAGRWSPFAFGVCETLFADLDQRVGASLRSGPRRELAADRVRSIACGERGGDDRAPGGVEQPLDGHRATEGGRKVQMTPFVELGGFLPRQLLVGELAPAAHRYCEAVGGECLRCVDQHVFILAVEVGAVARGPRQERDVRVAHVAARRGPSGCARGSERDVRCARGRRPPPVPSPCGA